MKKGLITSQIVKNIFITMLLFYFYFNTSNGKVILLPFLICSVAMLLKNISLLFNKSKYIDMFNKVFILSFLIFWFGALIFWCYTSIVNREYSSLIFSIPFWIGSIFIIKKFLLKINNKNHKLNINFGIVISCFLVSITFISGVLMLFFGIRDTYKLNNNTRGFITTNAYYKDYEIFNSDKDNTTYKLKYVYEVDNIEYEVSTNYGSNYIPDTTSIREVKYNPDDPSESILVGLNNKKGLIYTGAFFVLGSIPFILFGLMMLALFDKVKIDIIGTYIGFAFLIIGIGIILLQNKETMSLLEIIKAMRLWFLIPIMFIVVGIYQIINCLIIKKNKK